MSAVSFIIAPFILAGFIAAYMLPTIIAHRRKRVSFWAIAVCNAAFGLTVVGWFVCLIWALTGHAGSAQRAPA